MNAAAASGTGGAGTPLSPLTPPGGQEKGGAGHWEIFLSEQRLPITVPSDVPEARIRELCEALGIPYRYRPASLLTLPR